MSDIVERLGHVYDFGHTALDGLHKEAADEITRLRTAQKKLESRIDELLEENLSLLDELNACKAALYLGKEVY